MGDKNGSKPFVGCDKCSQRLDWDTEYLLHVHELLATDKIDRYWPAEQPVKFPLYFAFFFFFLMLF